MIKKILIPFVLILMINIVFSDSLLSQRRYNDEEEYNPQSSLRERLFVGAYINTPYFGGSTFGSQFGVGIQPLVGYRFNEYFAAGLTVKYDYTYFWSDVTTASLSDFSTTTFARAILARQIILQVEGGIYSDQSFIQSNVTERNLFPVSYLGVGYITGNTELLLSLEITGNLRQYQIPVEYKFGIIVDL